jgi:formyltetrahydrofolate-dependent phosphoribosylglycinamide formyltransferase
MSEPLRLAVFISGGGNTLQNLLDHAADDRLPARVVRVVSNNPRAYGLVRAENAGVPTTVVKRSSCPSVEDFSRRLFDPCRAAGAELVCLGGFLQLIQVPADYRWRVMNIHPALIPSFCGKGYYGEHVHQAVLEAGVKVTGCTVHFVDDEYDHGPIILQRAVPVLDDDTPDTLAARVFAAECEAYPEAVRLFAAGRLQVTGRRVRVSS